MEKLRNHGMKSKPGIDIDLLFRAKDAQENMRFFFLNQRLDRHTLLCIIQVYEIL
jgi:hypothetical protein